MWGTVMSTLASQVRRLSHRARAKRAQIFRSRFELTPDTRILDLGSEDGSHIHAVLDGNPVRPENVYIADIAAESGALDRGQRLYGYQTVPIDESGRLPFDDQYFDIVHSSSVI